MEYLIKILEQLGSQSLNLFWLPVIIWTIVAGFPAGFLKFAEKKISAIYHYYMRVVLLWGLAGGVVSAFLIRLYSFLTVTESAANPHFVVIQNPITVTATATSAPSGIDPIFWMGIATALVILAAVVAFIKLLVDFQSLRSFSGRLSSSKLNLTVSLTQKNRQLLSDYRHKISIIFSDDVAIPCTFGWFKKRIILPEHLRHAPQKMNMALRHELMHIQNGDFLVNMSVKVIKALFFLHPLVHLLTKNIEEYREICCDQRVLQDREISQKSYAQLLFELSPKSVFKTAAAVNMAVRPSTLKKRIQIMKTSTPKIPSLKWSLSIMLAATVILSGVISCSDMEDNGITQTDVQQTQANVKNMPSDAEPLYIINGEKMNTAKGKDIISRLDPKYIKSINVLKDKKATDVYGEAGKNGVIDIKLSVDKETAFNNLMDKTPSMPTQGDSNKNKIYVAVEQDPEIIGGKQALYDQLTPYPEKCKESGKEGRVILQFVVTKEGNIEDAQVVKGIGKACDQAALNAIKQVKFNPGRQRGKAVNVKYSWPVQFQLSGGNDSNNSVSSSNVNMQTQKMEVRNLKLSDNGTLTGKIYDKKNNEPLAGTNIIIKGTNKGTTTNTDGIFEIKNIRHNGKLRISFVGYTPLIINY